MVVLDFYNTQSSYKFTPDLFKYFLFQKLSKTFGFRRNQCKMQIMCRNALFFKTDFSCLLEILPSFIWR